MEKYNFKQNKHFNKIRNYSEEPPTIITTTSKSFGWKRVKNAGHISQMKTKEHVQCMCTAEPQPHLYKLLFVSTFLLICVCASPSNTGSLRCVRWVILAQSMSQTSRGPVGAGPAGVCLCPSKRSSLGPRHGERTAEPHGEVPLSKSLGPVDPTRGTWDLSTPGLPQTTHPHICHEMHFPMRVFAYILHRLRILWSCLNVTVRKDWSD